MNAIGSGHFRLACTIPLVGVVTLALAHSAVAQSDSQSVKTPSVLPLMQDVKVPWIAPPKPVDNTPEPVAAPNRSTTRKNPALDGAPAVRPLVDDDHVYTDEVAGSLWARGAAYKAQFEVGAASYIPFLGSQAPDNYPVSFVLSSVSVGGQLLPIDASAQPRFSGLSVHYDRGTLSEVYDLAVNSVEQSFVFDSLPAAGDLLLRVGIQTSLAASIVDGAIDFKNAIGGVRCSNAFAVDANGKRIDIPLTMDDGGVEMRVPASFVAQARFPLVVDPVLSTFGADTSSSVDSRPDVAYDATTAFYCFTWERVFSSTDHDIWAQMHDVDGNLIAGSGAYIDFTTNYWAQPKIANNNIADKFLVVAQVGLPTSGTREIWGRTRNAGSTTMSAQFQIDGNESGDKLNPDVGGDPVLTGPTYFLVVWQRVFASGDQDVHGRTVTASAALNGPGTILIDNTGATNDTNPAVSKSDGVEPFSTQEWNVVWQRTFASGDEDIRGAQIHWDGSITTPSFSVDFSASNDTNPSVSSELDTGARRYMAVYSRGTGTAHNLQATVYAGSTLVTSANLSALEAGSFLGEDQIRPSADADGTRFGVAYSESFSGSATDYDVYISTFNLSGSTLSAGTVHQNLAFSTSHEDWVEVTSEHSSGLDNSCFAASWEDDSTTANIEGGRFCNTTPTGTVTSVCAGSSGCPCAQNGGSPGGCPNSLNPAGALLTATGNASVSGDTFVIHGSGMPTTSTCLYFQGTTTIAGGGTVFGDGKRCAGGTVVRLGNKVNSGGASSYPSGSPAIHIKGMIPISGGTFTYQCWYRNANAFCTPSTFNLTNGLMVSWIP